MIAILAPLIFALGFDVAIGFVLILRRKEVKAQPQPILEPKTVSLEQRDYDFWFAECCRLKRLSEQAFEWQQYNNVIRIAHEYDVAEKRFRMAQNTLLKGHEN